MSHATLGAALVAFATCGMVGKRGAWVAVLIAVLGVFVIHPWAGYSSDTDPNGQATLAWIFIVIPLWLLLALGGAAGTLLNHHLRPARHRRR